MNLYMKKISFLLCVLFCTFANMQAQQGQSKEEYIDRNFKIDLPFEVLQISDESPARSKGVGHIEVINFGTLGNTIILKFECPELDKYYKESGQEKPHYYYSWSGKNVHLVKVVDSDGILYVILRGNKRGAVLGSYDGVKLMQIVNEEGVGTINYDIHKGMSRAEVERFLGGLGMKFQQTRNVGNLRIWTLKWFQLQDVYNIFGEVDHAELNNDRKYIDFYFDANDKLVKWIIYI